MIALKTHLEALEPKLGAIRCPIYIVHGTKDPLVPYSNMAFMQARFTAAPVETVTIPDENHFLPWNRQKELTETIGKLEALPPTHC
ncbi:alpha/beta hydrolase family protein [Hankyongella ginsenosidimutans]|uniref:alpha/beta hydrolase family protein n=1 Tax=Hankyongella ginsenosidimutans TaxID=1763828 RepID=UPI001CA30984|nr:alpha/beta fold hydrolase [Hankyongella ginsenosidimutans]